MNCPKCGLPMILTRGYREACCRPGYPFREYERMHPPTANDYECIPCDEPRKLPAWWGRPELLPKKPPGKRPARNG